MSMRRLRLLRDRAPRARDLLAPEERRFADELGHALAHATAVAAADPDTPLPKGSLPERVRTAHAKFRPEKREERAKRARELLDAPEHERRRVFGRAAGWTPDDAKTSDESLRKLLKQAVHSHVEARRHQVEQFFALHGIGAGMANWNPKATWVEVGHFGDVEAVFTSVPITTPSKLSFRWRTEEPDAKFGSWVLSRRDPGGLKFIAAGDAGQAPGWTVFTIDLRNYLPATPPAVPTRYEVRVIPRANPQERSKSHKAFPRSPIVRGVAVGHSSDPATIIYPSIAQPAVEIETYEVYRYLTVGLERIRLVEDQNGPGAEEFHVSGIVQQFLPSGSANTGRSERLSGYAALSPSGPYSLPLNTGAFFRLTNPDTADWPQAFALVVSVLEEDDGGKMAEWQGEISTVAYEFLAGEVNDAVTEYLQDNFDEFVGEDWETVAAHASEAAQYITSLVSGSAAAGYIGAALLVAGMVVAEIAIGAKDDFYGMEVQTLVVDTNIKDHIDHWFADGDFDDHSVELRWGMTLYGAASFPDAAPYDGEIEITASYRFWKVEDL